MPQKSKILSRLDFIQVQETLKEFHDWLETFMDAETKDTFESGEIQAVQEGYLQYMAGKTISHEEAKNRFEQWLAQKEITCPKS